jgi:hypothetical protein
VDPLWHAIFLKVICEKLPNVRLSSVLQNCLSQASQQMNQVVYIMQRNELNRRVVRLISEETLYVAPCVVGARVALTPFR